MTHNKIEVLFFSKSSVLSQCLNGLFGDEETFSCKGATTLNELRNLWQKNLDATIVIDLVDSILDFELIVNQEEISLLLRSFVFLFDNENQLNFLQKNNFLSYEVIFKPLRINDLFAKVRILSNSLKQLDLSLSFMRGSYFDVRKNQLRNSQGKTVRLTEKETKIISVLCKQQGKIISREVLLKSVWGYDETISTHTLETHIYRLRKKIELSLGETDLILKNKLGYFLSGPKSTNLVGELE